MRKARLLLFVFGLLVAYSECWARIRVFSYYEVEATHTRTKGINPLEPISSSFVGRLRMVRVQLPEVSKKGRSVVRTKIGKVDFKRDHLIDSIESLVAKFSGPGQLDYIPDRVDLITPARHLGFRFSPVAVYLGYRYMDDSAPSFYVLEAGDGSGNAKTLFFSPAMNKRVEGKSNYAPTPFSSRENIYSGKLTLQAGTPKILNLWVRGPEENEKPYIQIAAKFKPLKNPRPQYAATLLFAAHARVVTIAKVMKVAVKDIGKAFERLGKKLEWITFPQ